VACTGGVVLRTTNIARLVSMPYKLGGMTRHIRLKSVQLKSGRVLDISDGVTAIVGPNNAGKSLLLRELYERVVSDPGSFQLQNHKIVSDVGLNYVTSPEELVEDLRESYPFRPSGIYSGIWTDEAVVLANGQLMPLDTAANIWNRPGTFGSVFGSYFATYLNAESRLGLAADTGIFDSSEQSPSNPLQRMFDDVEIEKKVSKAVREAFGRGITVDRLPGSVIHLRSGETKTKATSLTPSEDYKNELRSLPLIQLQGDGIRAFVGMVMSVTTGQYPLLIIDEPEAFLHPPQARRFGQFLAQQRAGGTQIIVATHSEDIIAGLTSGGDQDEILLTRITRHDDQNYIAQLEPESVKLLFKDPLIRYFNMMNGLFAQGVVLCEADGDCTYFRASVDHVGTKKMPLLGDAHFTHAAGKSRIPKALAAFRSISVPTVAIFDIDILRDDPEFNALATAIGEDPSTFNAWRNVIKDDVSGAKMNVNRNQLRASINALIDSGSTKIVTQGDLRKIRDLATPASGWSNLKKAGIPMLSAGARAAYMSITSVLERKGVFILEQGELERLHPDVSGEDKAHWLRTIIDKKLYKKSPAKPMLERIEKYLDNSAPYV
jgi:ABC-type ATPase involved in cell division